MALDILGSKYCIDSLREDVNDLQEAVIDVFSRAGPVRTPSWKYPDKCANDLDMTELLELYDYSEDKEDRQIAHIVLLELVIDRLVLLVQAMSRFVDQSLGIKPSHNSPGTSTSSSIGLVVKKYWNKIVQANGALTQANTDLKQLRRKVSDLEEALGRESSQRKELQEVVETLNYTLRTAKTPFPLNDIDQMLSRASSAISISRDECIKATQTLQTAFVPCESCACVQEDFRSVGAQLTCLCTQHGLPSSVARMRKEMEGIDWMTAADVTRWATEQKSDLQRLEKLLSDFSKLQEDLSSERQKVKESNKKIEDCDKEIKLERLTQATQRKHYEKKIETIEKEKQNSLAVVNQQKEEVQRGKQQLETQLTELKHQYSTQQEILSQLEVAKQKVEAELVESCTNNEEVRRLEKHVTEADSRLREAQSRLEMAEQDLVRERAMVASTSKHTQSVQGKQEQLLQRLEDLDRENDELRTEVAELEESRDQLKDDLDKVKVEGEKLKDKHRHDQALVKQLQRDKASLEESLIGLQGDIHRLENTLQEAQEKYQLLVEYPDLNGPVNRDVEGTGDIARDMENQVKANTARIELLEQQNVRLRSTITKVLQTRKQAPSLAPQPSVPVPLWRNKTPIQEEEMVADNPEPQYAPVSSKRKPPVKESPERNKALEEVDPRFSVIIGKGAIGRGTETSKSSRSRPSSAAKSNSGTSHDRTNGDTSKGRSAKQAQNALKKSILGEKRPDSQKSDYDQQDVFTCPRCDKIYSSSRDLDIHSSYCRT